MFSCLFREVVAQTALGADLCLRADGTELAAQQCEVDLDRVVGGLAVRAPDPGLNGLARNDLTGIGKENVDQQRFLARQTDLARAALYGAAAAVKGQIARGEDLALDGRAAACCMRPFNEAASYALDAGCSARRTAASSSETNGSAST